MKLSSFCNGSVALGAFASTARTGTRLAILLAGFSAMTLPAAAAAEVLVAPGVWRVRIGEPEAITPVSARHFTPATAGLDGLPTVGAPPVGVQASISTRGTLVRIPLAPDERIYGLGLQLTSFEQRAKKKRLRVNADPTVDSGDSHAPVPFYVTSRGYGVLIDTARYATFYFGNKARLPETPPEAAVDSDRNDAWNGVPPYERLGFGKPSEVLVEIPQAQGVDVYVFAGPSLREAVQRYNLFSGGGVLPPRWGLGFWYRVQTQFSQDDVLRLTSEFRERRIPIDVLGLEPYWQSHAYSSSYAWGPRFPDPAALLRQLSALHMRVNLWEQAFVHRSSPIYAALHPHAGDYEVWDGLVPDFLQPEARRIFADYHEQAHVALGVSGYKADECDNSDFTGNWSFPEIARFPSGADGEQMHSLFGLRYQDALLSVFERRGQRTYGLVRSSGALAAPYPFVLYSDLYDHAQFIHGVAQSSFSGLLWTPEVRHAAGPEDLVRRLQSAVLSPLAMINAWYLRHPPWKQVNRSQNNAGDFAENWEELEARCRALIELRMQLVPYLHSAFVRYQREGLPPFRALVMDYPDDPLVATLSDQYLVGDALLVAPVTAGGEAGRARGATPPPPATGASGEVRRTVYLPAGEWYDFWTGEKHAGGQRLSVVVPLDRIPIYVKAGALLPLAEVTQHTDDPASRRLTVRVYGDGALGAHLYEDDGGWAPNLREVQLVWDASASEGQVAGGSEYSVTEWTTIH
jgi:alpha-D-xyloside xylohydrolase